MRDKIEADDSQRYELKSDPRLSLPTLLSKNYTGSRNEDARFELEFFERVVDCDPCNEEALMLLGHAYTRMGQYEKGMAIDQRLVRLRPSDPTVYYNLACSCALLDRMEDALIALERALALGYRDLDHMMKDPDLAKLRQDKRFRRLVGRMIAGSPSNS